MGRKVVDLVVVGDIEPTIFALNMAPVQLTQKGGATSFWSFAPWRKEVRLDSQLLLGGNKIITCGSG